MLGSELSEVRRLKDNRCDGVWEDVCLLEMREMRDNRRVDVGEVFENLAW